MRFAVFANVQGNVVALRAVMEGIRQEEDVTSVVCAGDLVGLGPRPNEVIDLLRLENVSAVLGNYDDAIAFQRLSPGVDYATAAEEAADRFAVAWTKSVLTDENMDYLRRLPRDLRIFELGRRSQVRANMRPEGQETMGAVLMRGFFGGLMRENRGPRRHQAFVAHGSPRALNEFIREDSATSILTALADLAKADVVVTGHAGEGYQREVGKTTFIGAPSVSGRTVVSGRAAYAVVEMGRTIETELRLVQYDADEYARDIADRGLPPDLIPYSR